MPKSTIHDTLGPQSASIRLLYINPNSSIGFTKETVSYLSGVIGPDVSIDFYTAPSPAPPSIDGTVDGVVSTYAVLHELGLLSTDAKEGRDKLLAYSAIVVGCFSSHPLIPALKECLAGTKNPASPAGKAPIILGILESSVHFAQQIGPTFGIATTGHQWEPLFDEAMRTIGVAASRYTGTVGTGYNAANLHGDGAKGSLLSASITLAERGAKVVILGCAGMAPMRKDIEAQLSQRVGKHIPVVDGVQAAVDTAIGFARMGLKLP